MPPRSTTRTPPGRASLTDRSEGPIGRQSLHREAADYLRRMIVRGELEEGEKIPFAALSEALGVSLTPLREAIKVLAEERLVELAPNRGAIVKRFEPEEAVKLFDVIAALESLAAERAATHMTEGDLAALEDMHGSMEKRFAANRKDAYFTLNSQIHERIVELADNEELAATHARLMVRASRGRFLALMDERRWREAMDEHRALMAALRARDAERAAQVWKTHLLHTGASLAAAIEARGKR